MNKIDNVDAYIAQFPKETQRLLGQVRTAIRETAPGAEELISYGMPGYKLYGKPVVYFAGYKKHIGFYATPNGHVEFAKEFSRYKQGKGSVQFPIEEPMPLELIQRVVQFRIRKIQENHG